jgi:hypothetical protein
LYSYENHIDEKDFVKLFKELIRWKIKRVTIITQIDGVSCGLVAYIFVILLSFRIGLESYVGTNFNITNDMMTNMRAKMASSILCKQLFFSKYYLENIQELSKKIMLLWDNTIQPKVYNIEQYLKQRDEQRDDEQKLKKQKTIKNRLSHKIFSVVFT